MTFIKADGRIKTQGNEGDNLLDVVVNNNIDLDGFGEFNFLKTTLSFYGI